MAAARPAPVPRRQQKAERELEDLQLVVKARNGDSAAMDHLIRRYTGFVRLKASSYFLAGGDGEDLVQEGLIGLYKAVRDFRHDKETSFRSFAELEPTEHSDRARGDLRDKLDAETLAQLERLRRGGTARDE